MQLAYTPAQNAFRAEARAWLEANAPRETLASFDTAAGATQHRAWEAKLNAGGYAMVPWPKKYGGRGANLLEWLIFEEEYYRANAPKRINQNGIFLLGPTLMEYGSEEQKARFLPKMASSEEVWAQGWSEPNAGSDMANIQARAERSGEHYVLNGQKTWASRGAFADWLFGMFRSDAQSERHRGLTFILCPLDAEGVSVRPIEQLDGLPGFAEVFFDNVRVPVANRLGREGEGWSVAMSTAGFERGLMLRSPARFQHTAARLVALYRECAATAEAASATVALGDEVARCWLSAEAYTLETYRTVSRLLTGGNIGAEASLNKIFWSELDLRMHELALEILDERGELHGDAPDAHSRGAWLDGYLFALAGPIYARHQRNPTQHRGRAHFGIAARMNFQFTAEQEMFQRTLREFLSAEFPPSRVRKLWSGDGAQELQSRLAELGVSALLVPEAHGGLARDELDFALPLEEIGRAGVATPVLVSAAVAAPLLRELGGATAERWLPQIAEGRAQVAVGVAHARFVEDAHGAALLLLANGDDELHAVTPEQCEIIPQRANDPARRIARVTFTPATKTRVADGAHARALLRRRLRPWRAARRRAGARRVRAHARTRGGLHRRA